MSICVLKILAHGSELKCPDAYLHFVKKLSGFFVLVQPGYVPLDALCLHFFSGFFFKNLRRGGGSVGQIIYREYIVFQGSNISCSLACVKKEGDELFPFKVLTYGNYFVHPFHQKIETLYVHIIFP